MQLQIKIKLEDLEYTVKRIKYYIFSKYSLCFVFLRDMHGGNLSLEENDRENKLLELLMLTAREKILIKFQHLNQYLS